MKKIFFTFIFAILILLNPAWAQLNVCPPPDTIRANATFIWGEKYQPQVNFWTFITKNFNYQNSDWNFLYATQIEILDSQDALAIGAKYFLENAQIKFPEEENAPNQISCNYFDIHNREIIVAFSPPLPPTHAASYLHHGAK